MTYLDLMARLNAVLADDHSTDADWATYLPAIIEQGELRCYRDIDFLSVRKTVQVQIAAGAGSFSAPSDWLLGQGVRLTDSNIALDRRDATFLSEYGGSGMPRYWAEPVQGTIQVAPIPTIPFNAELTYHFRPAPLSASNLSTWLATNCPDLLFYACMVATSGYMRNFGAQADDPRSALSWEQQYQAALASVKREEGRRKGDNAFDSSGAPPPPGNTP